MATRKREANQPDAPVRVFISATSKDLATVRELVKQALLTMGCMPVEQTNFAPDYRSVQGMIEHKIADCEAVIHIVGLRYGAEPDVTTLPEGAAPVPIRRWKRTSHASLEKNSICSSARRISRTMTPRLRAKICRPDNERPARKFQRARLSARK